MTESFRSGWLGFLTSNLLYVDFSKAESDEEVYDKAIEDLVKQLDFYMVGFLLVTIVTLLVTTSYHSLVPQIANQKQTAK